MRSSPSGSWVPLGVAAALALSLAAAWAFRDRLSDSARCAALYVDAATATDSAQIDALVVVPDDDEPAITCADLRRDPPRPDGSAGAPASPGSVGAPASSGSPGGTGRDWGGH